MIALKGPSKAGRAAAAAASLSERQKAISVLKGVELTADKE